MPFRTLLPYVFLIFIQTVVSQFKCDYRMYGRPNLNDCASAWLAMPDSRAKVPTPRLEDFRRFVEPQLLEPPFSTLKNDFGTAMEQVPKFWRYKTCRFALTVTAAANGRVIDPGPASTWEYVEHEALKLSRNCVGKGKEGGIVLIGDPVGSGALSLYMYAVGSPFEAILNNYMITSQALHPPELVHQGLNSSWTWLAADGSVISPPITSIKLLQSLQSNRLANNP